jgi:hypothetical protein
MAEPEKRATITLQELMVSTLDMADALATLLIGKGIIIEEEFKTKLARGAGDVSGDSQVY